MEHWPKLRTPQGWIRFSLYHEWKTDQSSGHHKAGLGLACIMDIYVQDSPRGSKTKMGKRETQIGCCKSSTTTSWRPKKETGASWKPSSHRDQDTIQCLTNFSRFIVGTYSIEKPSDFCQYVLTTFRTAGCKESIERRSTLKVPRHKPMKYLWAALNMHPYTYTGTCSADLCFAHWTLCVVH